MKTKTILSISGAIVIGMSIMTSSLFTGCTKAEEEFLVDPNKKPEQEEPDEPDKPIVLDGEIVAYPAIQSLETSDDFKVTANGTALWVEKY